MVGSGPSGYTPSQITQAYGFNQISFTKISATIRGNGAGQTIAIVDAYNNPNISSDLQVFDKQFGLPDANLRVIGQSGGPAPMAIDPSGSWELEESLDVEWAHAIAPGASIVLVEADSDDLSNLLAAVKTAANLPGVSVVSMSWGVNEFAEEIGYDSSYFSAPNVPANVAFVAASGDNGAPPIYPAISPNVLAVGGTTLTLTSTNDWASEIGWSGSGGGLSAYEAQPSYQKGVVTQSNTQRANPDVAYDADPNTGYAVYDSNPFGEGAGPWYKVGGTSAAAPQWAGLVAIADQGRVLKGDSTLGPSQLLTSIYQMPASNFHDIISGSSNGNPVYTAGPGYDLVTGRGSPLANRVVSSLVNDAASPSPSPSPSPSASPPPSSPPPAPPPAPPPSPSPSPSPSPVSGLLPDGGFEQPHVGAHAVVNPGGSPWTFSGYAGVAGNGSLLTSGNPPAPEGVQVGFLTNNYSTISQTIPLRFGYIYTLNFYAAQAGFDQTSSQEIEVLVNSTPVALLIPSSTFYTAYSSAPFYATANGNYTVTFLALNSWGGSSTALLDQVSLTATSTSLKPFLSGPATAVSPSPLAPPAGTGSTGGPSPTASSASQASSADSASATTLATWPRIWLSQIVAALDINPLFHELGTLLTMVETLGPLGELLEMAWIDAIVRGQSS